MDFVIYFELMIDIFLTALGLYICIFEELNQIAIGILLSTSNVLFIIQHFKVHEIRIKILLLYISYSGKYIALWLLNKQFMWQVINCQILLNRNDVILNIFNLDGLRDNNVVVLSLEFLIVLVLFVWLFRIQKPQKYTEQVIIDLGSENRLKQELTPSQSPRMQQKNLFKQSNYIILKENLEILETNFDIKCHLFNESNITKVYEQFLFLQITSSNFGENEQVYNIKEFMQQFENDLKKQFATILINKNQFFDLENVTIIIFPLQDNDNIHYLLSFQYLSQQVTRRLQEQENNQVLMDIGRSLSHELGTNLNSIIVFTDLAMHDNEIPIYVKTKYLQPLKVNSEQLGLIVSNIRDYNLINLQQFNLKLEEFSISDEIKYVESLIGDVIKNKQINIKYDITTQTNIVNDRQRFRQVYFQFLHNAVKYTTQGTICVRIETNRSQCQISIHDSGPGLSEDEMARLQYLISRNQFIKVSNNSVGCGLGLGISNSIIKRLNGRNIPIICDQKDQGTVFTFLIKNHLSELNNYDLRRSLEIKSSRSIIRLISGNSYIESPFTNSVKFIRPSQSIDSAHYRNSECDSICDKIPKLRMIPDQVSVPISEDEYLFIQEPRNLSPKFQYEIIECSISSNCCSRVLIIDDEYFNILSLTLLMQKHQAKCDYAYNGKEGLLKIMQKLEIGCQKCQNKFYSLIFIDINMPILDGYETVKEIKNLIKNRTIRKAWCVANTGFTDLDTKMQSIKSGMDYFLTKPLDAKNLHELILQMFPLHK